MFMAGVGGGEEKGHQTSIRTTVELKFGIAPAENEPELHPKQQGDSCKSLQKGFRASEHDPRVTQTTSQNAIPCHQFSRPPLPPPSWVAPTRGRASRLLSRPIGGQQAGPSNLCVPKCQPRPRMPERQLQAMASTHPHTQIQKETPAKVCRIGS